MPSADDFNVTTAIRSDKLLLECSENKRFWGEDVVPCQFYMLGHHRDRIVAASKAFGRNASVLDGDNGLAMLWKELAQHLEQMYDDPCFPLPLKLRVEFLPNQAFSIVSTPVVEIPRERFFPIDFSSIANSPHVDTWDIYISPNPSPRSLFTVHKTTHRAEYDAARAFLPSLNQHRVTTTTSRHHADSAAKDKDPVNMPHSPPDPAPPPPPRLVGEEILLVTNDEWGEQLIMEGSITTPYFWRHERWVTPDAGGHAGTTRRYALEKGLCVTDRLSVVSVQEGETLLLSNGVIGWVRGRVVKLGDKWIKKEEGEGLL